MPITYHIDPRLNLVVTHAIGVLTDEDVLIHKRQLAADPGFTPDMAQISDVRGITDLRVTPDGVRAMVALDQRGGADRAPQRLAIVADHDVVFGMARMYEILTEPNAMNVKVFRDYAEAVRWLSGAPMN